MKLSHHSPRQPFVLILLLLLGLPWACQNTYSLAPLTSSSSTTATPTVSSACGTGNHPYLTQWGSTGSGNTQFNGVV